MAFTLLGLATADDAAVIERGRRAIREKDDATIVLVADELKYRGLALLSASPKEAIQKAKKPRRKAI